MLTNLAAQQLEACYQTPSFHLSSLTILSSFCISTVHSFIHHSAFIYGPTELALKISHFLPPLFSLTALIGGTALALKATRASFESWGAHILSRELTLEPEAEYSIILYYITPSHQEMWLKFQVSRLLSRPIAEEIYTTVQQIVCFVEITYAHSYTEHKFKTRTLYCKFNLGCYLGLSV